jgi:phosphoglycolate phosphatase
VFKHLLCDLDGTLVDSSDGILRTLRSCLAAAGIAEKTAITSALVGPPLRSLIQTVTELRGPDALADIEGAFRREYDEKGYLGTRAYPGINEALVNLRQRGVTLHIVTNKRQTPTNRILDMVGWRDWFSTVSTLDSSNSRSKTEMLTYLLPRLHTSYSSMAFVGDSLEDERAARYHGIFFARATWGYGRGQFHALSVPLLEPAQIVRLVLHGDVGVMRHGS